MKSTLTPKPSPESGTPHMPVWMPAQFKPDSEISEYERIQRRKRIARSHDDYAGRDFTLAETIANSVSQGVAALLAFIGLIICIVTAVSHGGGIHLVAALIFAIPMLLAFLMSTLYHALQSETAKQVFKVLDQSSTYLLLAGSFTPYCLITLSDAGGYQLCAALWVMAIIGVVIEAVWATRPRWIHGVIYGLMCLAFLLFFPALASALPTPGLVLLIIALILFAVGLGFRWFSGIQFLRFVFHVVVIAACVCLFLSVVLFVI